MCLILFSYNPSSSTPLILSANRDEFFARLTAKAQLWPDQEGLLAGKDLVGGGTWIGLTEGGRFATVTNVREPGVVVENPKSRGDLTRRFLSGQASCEDYLATIEQEKEHYSGFNLLVGEFSEDKCELFYLSNRKPGIHKLDAGVYGLSNHLLDSSWPKVDAGKVHLRDTLNTTSEALDYHQSLRCYLENPSLASDDILPKTGVPYEREKALSAAFITLPDYGTRTSTVITISDSKMVFSEKNYLDTTLDQHTDVDDYQVFELTLPSSSQALLEKRPMAAQLAS